MGGLGTVGSVIEGLFARGGRTRSGGFRRAGGGDLVVSRARGAGTASRAWTARGWGGAWGSRGHRVRESSGVGCGVSGRYLCRRRGRTSGRTNRGRRARLRSEGQRRAIASAEAARPDGLSGGRGYVLGQPGYHEGVVSLAGGGPREPAGGGTVHRRAEPGQLPRRFRGGGTTRDVRRRTHWAGWTGAAFGKLLTRLVSRLAQVVRVDPERAGLSSLAFGAAVLGRGRNLVWFAEGERSRTGSLQPFKPGVGMILDHDPVPVVPVFVRGTYGARPRGRFLRRFEKVSVTCGEPFDPGGPDRNAETREQVVEALRGRVFELGQRR